MAGALVEERAGQGVAAAAAATPRFDWRRAGRAARPWLPVALGLAALLAPAWLELARTTWDTPENGHGPVLFGVTAWLLWRQRGVLGGVAGGGTGWVVLLVGLALFVIGASQGIDTLVVAAHLPVLAGVALLMSGPAALRALWFPLAFLAFAIPVPGQWLELVTGALKRAVSAGAVEVLHLFGLPVARDGVVLVIGQYQLLVADACSGMNSLITLAALGALVLYLRQAGADGLKHDAKRGAHGGPMRTTPRAASRTTPCAAAPATPRTTPLVTPHRMWRGALLMLAVLPIAFIANLVRVLLLVLITWTWGDAAGQGIAHGLAGLLLFAVALGLLLGCDRLLQATGRRNR